MSLNVCLTGGTSGVGKQLCKQLLQQGHKVCLLYRGSEDKIKQLSTELRSGAELHPVPCDLAQLSSVRTAAERIQKLPLISLDVLVLNAGIMKHNLEVGVDGFEATLLTNHLSQLLLLHQLRPMLQASKNKPRVVIVSSELHKRPLRQQSKDMHEALFRMSPSALTHLANNNHTEKPYDGNQAYAISKLYNVLTARTVAKVLGDSAWVASVSPGFIPSTSLHRDASWAGQMFMKYIMPWAPFSVTVEEGSRRVAVVALDADAPNLAPSGTYWSRGRPDPSTHAADDSEAAEKLWDLSCKVLGLDPEFK